MPRKPLIRTKTGIYHVSARVNHRANFPLPLSECWNIFLKLIAVANEKWEAKVHAFVLMSNHYHMMLSTPRGNIDAIMKHFNREATRTFAKRANLVNHIFGARYHWTISTEQAAVAHVLKYVYRNPVKAGLVKNVEDYPFSTLPFLTDKKRYPSLHPIACLDPHRAHGGPDEVIRWLNIPLKKEQDELIRKAMKRAEFAFPASRRYRRAIDNIPKNPW